ncbi:hypothetical protein P3S67_030132 [Capsicum chacoense]
MFNTLDDHYSTPEPTSMLVRSPKFLTNKSDMTEEQEKMARKMKSTEKATKNSQGITNYEDVSYKDGDVSSSVNLPPNLEISKFEKHVVTRILGKIEFKRFNSVILSPF